MYMYITSMLVMEEKYILVGIVDKVIAYYNTVFCSAV